MFEFIEHTADMGLEARADSLAAVYVAMAHGLMQMIFGAKIAGSSYQEEINLRADDPVELLVGWLNELVFRLEKYDLVFNNFTILSISENELHAIVSGERFDAMRHHIERQVKSATYHQAALEHRKDCWYARVYVDL
jgi:SHS2 domain-containing protein